MKSNCEPRKPKSRNSRVCDLSVFAPESQDSNRYDTLRPDLVAIYFLGKGGKLEGGWRGKVPVGLG